MLQWKKKSTWSLVSSLSLSKRSPKVLSLLIAAETVHCNIYLLYLNGFIEPAIGRVPIATTAMDHLQSSARVDVFAGIAAVDHWRLFTILPQHRSIDADDHARRFDRLQRADVD